MRQLGIVCLLLFDPFVRKAASSTLFGKLTSFASKIATLEDPIDWTLNAALDQTQVVMNYKARIAQAHHFLGDTFAERFGDYIRGQERFGSLLGISASGIVDSNKYTKAITDYAADKIVGDVVIKAETTALKTFLPKPFDVIGYLLENQHVLYYTRTYLGTGLAYILFHQGAFAITIVALLPYIMRNLWIFRTVFRETCQMVRLMRSGAITLAATELIDPNIPPFILDDFVMRNKGMLAYSKWPSGALKKMTQIPMPLFVNYYSVLIRHFPEFLSGPQSVISSSYGWLFSKPSDLVLKFCDLVGMFKLSKPLNVKAFRSLVRAMQPKTKDEISRVDEMALLIIDYYLTQIGVVDSLTVKTSIEKTFDDMCRVIVKLFLPFDEIVEFVVKSGLVGLSALAAKVLPVKKMTVKRQGLELLEFAVREGKPLSMLAVMKHIDIPKTYRLEDIKPKRELKDGASRTRRLVFEAFLLLRNNKNHTTFLCRNTLYPRTNGFAYLYDFPVNLSFLPKATESPMTEEEIRNVAAAVANLVFEIPLHEAIEMKKIGSTVIETVNLLIANHCGFFKDRLIKATTVQYSTKPQQNRPLLPGKLEFRSRSSLIHFNRRGNNNRIAKKRINN